MNSIGKEAIDGVVKGVVFLVTFWLIIAAGVAALAVVGVGL